MAEIMVRGADQGGEERAQHSLAASPFLLSSQDRKRGSKELMKQFEENTALFSLFVLPKRPRMC